MSEEPENVAGSSRALVRWLKRGAIALFLVTVLSIAALLVLRAYSAERLRAAIERIEGDGYSLSVDEAMTRHYPPLPEGDDAGPLWAQFDDQIDIEALPDHDFSGFVRTFPDGEETVPEEGWKELRAYLGDYSELLSRIDEAVGRSGSRREPDEDGFFNCNAYSITSMLVEKSTQLALHDGSPDELGKCLCRALAFARHYSDIELIGRSAELADLRDFLRLLPRWLPMDPSASALLALQEQVQLSRDRTPVSASPIRLAVWHEAMAQRRLPLTDYYELPVRASVLELLGVIDIMHAIDLELAHECLLILRLPPSEQLPEAERIDARIRAVRWPLELAARVPVASTIWMQRTQESYLAIADAAIGVELERRQSGALPQRLPSSALDGYGDPLVYKLAADGYRIYALGRDRNDDGGDPDNDLVLQVRLKE